MAGQMKVKVNKDLCRGTGICESICPEVFAVGKNGTAEVKQEIIPENLQASCHRAAQSCPADAVHIIEE
jgi:ferredoxin